MNNKVRNCDKYKTPKEIRTAYYDYCKGKNCDECKYGSYFSSKCLFEFAYDYAEVKEDKKELHDALEEATKYFREHTGKEFI